ncbi:MAG: thioredoxin [Nanoarchaeota archaeon]|nr:thioredoxin [Nanoarchaeota archaeon]
MVEGVVELMTEKEFNDFVKESVVVVDFFAEWCMPCVMMGPIFEELSEKFKGKIKFAKVNINGNEDLAQKFEVSSIPNFILFKDGEVKERFVGAMTGDEFEEKLKAFV